MINRKLEDIVNENLRYFPVVTFFLFNLPKCDDALGGGRHQLLFGFCFSPK